MFAGLRYRAWMNIYYLLLVFLLSGCTQQMKIHFYDNEQWKVDLQIKYDAAFLDSLTSLALEALDAFFPIEIHGSTNEASLMDSALEALIAYYSAQGIDAQWKRSPARSEQRAYRLVLEGQSYATFERLLAPGMISLTPQGEDRYHLVIYLDDLNTLASLFYRQSITVYAGNIYRSNAPRQRGNTAAWQNPGEVDVIFSPARSPTRGLPVFLGVFVLLGLGFVVAHSVGGQRCPRCGARLPQGAEFCTECGKWLLNTGGR